MRRVGSGWVDRGGDLIVLLIEHSSLALHLLALCCAHSYQPGTGITTCSHLLATLVARGGLLAAELLSQQSAKQKRQCLLTTAKGRGASANWTVSPQLLTFNLAYVCPPCPPS